MRIAFSTLGCPDFDWVDIYTMAKDFQFDGIEIRGNAFAGEGVDVEYQMLAKPRGTEEWQLVRDYSPASSAIWNPDARGTYDIRVNVRARGSDVDYDHFNTAQVIY